jgi:hypothetical protein
MLVLTDKQMVSASPVVIPSNSVLVKHVIASFLIPDIGTLQYQYGCSVSLSFAVPG